MRLLHRDLYLPGAGMRGLGQDYSQNAVLVLGAGALSVLFALLLAAAISEVTTGANAVKAAAAAVIAISFLI